MLASGGTDPVISIEWSPDGKMLASGDTAGTINIETIPERGLTAELFKCLMERIGKESCSAMQKRSKSKLALQEIERSLR
jgi:hypothetical protein